MDPQYKSIAEISKLIVRPTPTAADSLNIEKPKYLKMIEIYDLSTKRTLRVFPNMKLLTSSLLNISMTSILSTCAGIRENYVGLGWRFYNGPIYTDCKFLIMLPNAHFLLMF